MPQSKAARALQAATDTLFCVCFGAVLVRMLAKGAVYLNDMPAQPSNRVALLLGLVWLGGLLAANVWLRRLSHSAVGRFFGQWRGIALVFGALLMAQLFIALSCYTPCGWDPQVLLTTANELLTGVPYTGTYFHQNPNNLFLLGCYRLLFVVLNRFGVTDYLPWVVAGSAFLVWLSVLLLFLLVQRLFGVRVAWLSFFLCAPMAALSPWIAVPYSDTFGMPFAIGGLYCYVMAREETRARRSALWAVTCGAVLVLGARVKPTVLLVVIAAVLVEAVCHTGQRTARKTQTTQPQAEVTPNAAEEQGVGNARSVDFEQPAVAAFAAQAAVAPSAQIASALQGQAAPQIAAQANPQASSQATFSSQAQAMPRASVQSTRPQTWFTRFACSALIIRSAHSVLLRTVACLALGAVLSYGACGWFQQRTAGRVLDPLRAKQEQFSATHYFMMGFSQPYGSYAYEDMQYTEAIKGSGPKTKANLDEAARRMREMGPMGYASFLWRKLLFSWTDGTFFFGREGAFYWGEPPQQSEAARAVQGVFRADQPGYGLLALWQQMQWVLCLLLMLCGVLYRTGKHAKWFWLARVCTLGLVCFLLVFEARSRYVYHFVPILCFAALAGLLVLVDELRSRKGLRQ